MNDSAVKHISFFFFITLNSSAVAQLYPGITAGYQITSFHDKHDKSNWSAANSFRAGGFVDYPFSGLAGSAQRPRFVKTRFGTRLEIAYSLVRGEDEIINDNLSLHYLSLPASFFYMPNQQVQLFIGPQLNILVQQTDSKSRIDTFDKIDFGVHASLEILFLHHTSVVFRYYQGLKYNTVNNENRLGTIQLCLNYFLSGKPE